MYDHPPSIPSPFTSSVALSSTKASRSHSPIPHISTLLPNHHHHLPLHHHHGQYSPNSRAADISRLLDPAYTSSSSSSSGSSSRSSSQQTQTRAYVDHHGDLHDPDYRDFPVLPTRQKPNAPRRRHTASTAQLQSRIASSTRPDRYSTYPLVARPEWERDWGTEVEDLDEDEEDVHDLNTSYAPTSSSRTTPSSRRASLPPSIYAHSSFFYNEPVSMTSSPVDSLDEQEEGALGLSGSPFEDLGMEETEEQVSASPSKTTRTSSLLRRMKRNSSQSSVPGAEQPAQPQQSQEEETEHAEPVSEDPFRSPMEYDENVV
ncbi:hypothetical protein PHLCEN_2v7760 [Hermanssonia centrifuga]|uniref:Uncharacterized protein n=1 Tax=Hermanssonia centrifuga TaxID=98765 RepID=A0A2R6NVF8_9APHY|nr:hypothetical protein PHLCEN_2v7760 [Hermanssonia centrifuga]